MHWWWPLQSVCRGGYAFADQLKVVWSFFFQRIVFSFSSVTLSADRNAVMPRSLEDLVLLHLPKTLCPAQSPKWGQRWWTHLQYCRTPLPVLFVLASCMSPHHSDSVISLSLFHGCWEQTGRHWCGGCSVNSFDQLVLSWLRYACVNVGLQPLDPTRADMHSDHGCRYLSTCFCCRHSSTCSVSTRLSTTFVPCLNWSRKTVQRDTSSAWRWRDSRKEPHKSGPCSPECSASLLNKISRYTRDVMLAPNDVCIFCNFCWCVEWLAVTCT